MIDFDSNQSYQNTKNTKNTQNILLKPKLPKLPKLSKLPKLPKFIQNCFLKIASTQITQSLFVISNDKNVNPLFLFLVDHKS